MILLLLTKIEKLYKLIGIKEIFLEKISNFLLPSLRQEFQKFLSQKFMKFFANSSANVFATDKSICEALYETVIYRITYFSKVICFNFFAIQFPPFVANKTVSYVGNRRLFFSTRAQ